MHRAALLAGVTLAAAALPSLVPGARGQDEANQGPRFVGYRCTVPASGEGSPREIVAIPVTGALRVFASEPFREDRILAADGSFLFPTDEGFALIRDRETLAGKLPARSRGSRRRALVRSPDDGSRVAFADGAKLFVFEPAKTHPGEQAAVTEVPTGLGRFDPISVVRWSPTGLHVLIQAHDSARDQDEIVSCGVGEKPRTIAHGRELAQWLPLALGNQRADAVVLHGESVLELARSADQPPVQLARLEDLDHATGHVTDSARSGDGFVLAVAVDVPQDRIQDRPARRDVALVSVSPSGTAEVERFGTGSGDPLLSPDAQHVVWLSPLEARLCHRAVAKGSELASIDLREALRSEANRDFLENVTAQAWDTTGRRLALGAGRRVIVADLASGTARVVASVGETPRPGFSYEKSVVREIVWQGDDLVLLAEQGH